MRLDRPALAAAVKQLCRSDQSLARIVAAYGPPPLWARPGGYRTLARIILEQQVSLRSAATLIRRLEGELGGAITAPAVVARGERGLRALGLTRQKASYLFSIATESTSGVLDFRAIGRMGDDAAHARLVALRGIGPWTAAIYLLMCLGRPDIWPTGDLALHVALARSRGRRALPSSAEAARHAERWRPWRSVAARILWHGYLSDPPRR